MKNSPVTATASQPTPPPKPRATGTPEDAHNHLLRGLAAIEMAKSSGDMSLAEDEFRMATEIEPKMANAWFNLGKVQALMGEYTKAMASYRQYLTLAPEAKDAQRVRDEIVKLQFRQEILKKTQSRVGTWVGKDGTLYTLSLNGDRMILKTDRRRIPEDIVNSTYSFVGTEVNDTFVHAEYQLALHGHHLTGTWSRAGVRVRSCTVPPDTAAVSGELSDEDSRMVLRHDVTPYRAHTQMSLFGDDVCSEISAGDRRTTEEVLYGPLAKGGLGVPLFGLAYWDNADFTDPPYGWRGRLRVWDVPTGTSAYAAGLRKGDEILAIDGVAVKTLSAGKTMVRLRGKPGSELTLEVWRKGEKGTIVLRLHRVEVPLTQPKEGCLAY
jgi:hypothetical protein